MVFFYSVQHCLYILCLLVSSTKLWIFDEVYCILFLSVFHLLLYLKNFSSHLLYTSMYSFQNIQCTQYNARLGKSDLSMKCKCWLLAYIVLASAEKILQFNHIAEHRITKYCQEIGNWSLNPNFLRHYIRIYTGCKINYIPIVQKLVARKLSLMLCMHC